MVAVAAAVGAAAIVEIAAATAEIAATAGKGPALPSAK
jgi:hypothetical protein